MRLLRRAALLCGVCIRALHVCNRRFQTFCKSCGQETQTDIAWYRQQKTVEKQRPQADGSVDHEIADDIIIEHSHDIYNRKSGKICCQHSAEGQPFQSFRHLSGEVASCHKADDITKAWFQKIPESAALCKDRKTDKTQKGVKPDAGCSQPSAQQKACHHGEQKLQGKGDHRYGDLDKSADGSQYGEQGTECHFSGSDLFFHDDIRSITFVVDFSSRYLNRKKDNCQPLYKNG